MATGVYAVDESMQSCWRTLMQLPHSTSLYRREQDSSYGRLLRRLDRALDMARTREWLAGQTGTLTELELDGLSADDLQLLWRILQTLDDGSFSLSLLLPSSQPAG